MHSRDDQVARALRVIAHDGAGNAALAMEMADWLDRRLASGRRAPRRVPRAPARGGAGPWMRLVFGALLAGCSQGGRPARTLPLASVPATAAGEPGDAPTPTPAPASTPVESVAETAPAPTAPVGSPTGAALPPTAARETSARIDPPPDGMLLVPGGTFTMGSDAAGEEDEHPAHRVSIGAFFLDRTEVTHAAYRECVDAAICRPFGPAEPATYGDRVFRGDLQPVSSVAWEDAQTYCRWRGKRLPREAEWEHAARGDDARVYPWGNDDPNADRAVFGGRRTAAVGSHPAGAGPYGHLDLAGNVWEWVDDLYDPYAYRRPTADRGVPGTCPEILATQDELRRAGRQGFTGTNPIPTECEHVLRGGAFNYRGDGLRASNRVHHPGRFRLIMAGFRCALDATHTEPPRE